MRRYLYISGMLSPLVYIVMTIIGGAMRPGYSHIYHAVSELLEAGAPNKLLLDILLTLSDILGLLFSVGVLLLVKERFEKRSIGMIGAYCLILVSFLGLLTAIFFPMDPRHAELTFPGMMHLIIVSVMAILSVVTPLFMAVWFKNQTDFVKFGTYSYISAILILATGALAAAAAFIESPYMGLAERLTVVAYFQWAFLMAVMMFRKS